MKCQEVLSWIFHVRGWDCHIYVLIVHELTGVSGSAPFTAYLPCKSARVYADADTFTGIHVAGYCMCPFSQACQGMFQQSVHCSSWRMP